MVRNNLGRFFVKFSVLLKLRNRISENFPSYFYFPSYSQWGEDAVISQFLHSKVGSYIDIGSGHPVKGNNTYFLYQRGWTGILIDPIAVNVELTKKYRPKDEILQRIVSNSIDSLDFWEFYNYRISTTNSNRAKLLLDQEESLKAKYSVTSISLSKIISNYDIQTKVMPELLSIDVEGSELEVLSSNDWNIFNPRVVCIEILNECLTEELFRNNEVFSFLFSKGYVLRASVGNSQIFIKDN